jgi:hypothetical protein
VENGFLGYKGFEIKNSEFRQPISGFEEKIVFITILDYVIFKCLFLAEDAHVVCPASLATQCGTVGVMISQVAQDLERLNK